MIVELESRSIAQTIVLPLQEITGAIQIRITIIIQILPTIVGIIGIETTHIITILVIILTIIITHTHTQTRSMFTHIVQDAITVFTQAVTPTTIIITGATLTHRVQRSVTHTMIAMVTIGLRADIKNDLGKV